ncbi:MAG: alpha/beta hydrolase [Gammaproteobacteria bacterium]|nr:alpha/beta hydrolase [Gammaproteobacteria bacterium]MBU1556426.1 alpha/beta hydrolase [Gammaproteobacteria bacterium]MBU2071990.1 alpha/beta hydrolase [Gammaproteobacteria bacterium]MBU2183925.1 alpha/beta hydrolase [Gammaproteobacteria bacterium]MBU2203321.1 alpha/beta hydrolase [Gammaproteobacteria bacterium]
MSKHTNHHATTTTKAKPGFWTHFAISLTIVGGMLAANFSSKAAQSFSVEVIGSGKPVLMIPGLMSDARVWRPTAETLANQYQLHLISIAGFAGQPAIDGDLLPTVKQQLLRYIEQNNLQQPAVVGHSLGAFMAFNLASTAPDKIGTVIAVDGLPYLAPVFTRTNDTTVAMMQGQAGYLRQQYQHMTSEQLKAMTAQGLFIQATSASHQQQVLDMAATSDPKAAGQAVYELLTTDLRPEVHNIKSKVLLIGASGAMANETDRSAAQVLYQQQIASIANATLEFNPQARHFIMLDQPDWLAARIARALKD